MHLFHRIVKATFHSRPNRFVVVCILEGRRVKTYMPNPGRLWELFLPGVVVYLTPANNPLAKLAYTLIAVERDGHPVMLHTHKTNDVAQWLLQEKKIPGFEKAVIERREAIKGGSRFDFLLAQGKSKIYLEVKSCTLFGDKVAMFPDAVTARGRRHVEELAGLKSPACRGAVLFVVHSSRMHYFMPDYHTDFEFSQTLLRYRNHIDVKAVGVAWDHAMRFSSVKPLLHIPWDCIERECHDQGAYMIILRLRTARKIEIGSLGPVLFQAGYYVYVGSARQALSKRIDRHRKLGKKKHWHIDYLREQAEWIASLPIRNSADLECEIAGKQKAIAGWGVPGFGCTDCSCSSHLFGHRTHPLENADFHRYLQYFRMDRLFRPDIQKNVITVTKKTSSR